MQPTTLVQISLSLALGLRGWSFPQLEQICQVLKHTQRACKFIRRCHSRAESLLKGLKFHRKFMLLLLPQPHWQISPSDARPDCQEPLEVRESAYSSAPGVTGANLPADLESP